MLSEISSLFGLSRYLDRTFCSANWLNLSQKVKSPTVINSRLTFQQHRRWTVLLSIVYRVIQCSGLHKHVAESPQSPLATDGVFDNNGSDNNSMVPLHHGTIDISLESSSSTSLYVNGHQGQMSYNAAHLIPGPPSSKISSL